MSIIMEEIQENIQEETTKKMPFVPKGNSKRFNKESGKYNRKPLDPDYFNKYYHENNVMMPCLHCGKMVGKLKMCRHIKTKSCLEAQMLSPPEPSDKPNKPTKYVEKFEDKVLQILEKHLENLKML